MSENILSSIISDIIHIITLTEIFSRILKVKYLKNHLNSQINSFSITERSFLLFICKFFNVSYQNKVFLLVD